MGGPGLESSLQCLELFFLLLAYAFKYFSLLTHTKVGSVFFFEVKTRGLFYIPLFNENIVHLDFTRRVTSLARYDSMDATGPLTYEKHKKRRRHSPKFP